MHLRNATDAMCDECGRVLRSHPSNDDCFAVTWIKCNYFIFPRSFGVWIWISNMFDTSIPISFLRRNLSFWYFFFQLWSIKFQSKIRKVQKKVKPAKVSAYVSTHFVLMCWMRIANKFCILCLKQTWIWLARIERTFFPEWWPIVNTNHKKTKLFNLINYFVSLYVFLTKVDASLHFFSHRIHSEFS